MWRTDLAERHLIQSSPRAFDDCDSAFTDNLSIVRTDWLLSFWTVVMCFQGVNEEGLEGEKPLT